MLFDTDVLIWIERGNMAAADCVDAAERRCISIQTYMELMQCAPDKHHQRVTREFLRDLAFEFLPLSENIGHRAAVYIDEYSLGHGLRTADALIAATATEVGMPLVSGNVKHFSPIKGLDLRAFEPG